MIELALMLAPVLAVGVMTVRLKPHKPLEGKFSPGLSLLLIAAVLANLAYRLVHGANAVAVLILGCGVAAGVWTFRAAARGKAADDERQALLRRLEGDGNGLA